MLRHFLRFLVMLKRLWCNSLRQIVVSRDISWEIRLNLHKKWFFFQNLFERTKKGVLMVLSRIGIWRFRRLVFKEYHFSDFWIKFRIQRNNCLFKNRAKIILNSGYLRIVTVLQRSRNFRLRYLSQKISSRLGQRSAQRV